MNSGPTPNFDPVRHFVFDIDGVLTDGTVWVMPEGDQVRRMNIKDGYALQLAHRLGYSVCVVSGSAPSSVKDRLLKLGITDIHFSVTDKAAFLTDTIRENGWDRANVLYMGDDLPDLPVMSLAGVATCPRDAAPELLASAHYISPLNGGWGCVRDVIEQVLRSHGQWAHQTGISSR